MGADNVGPIVYRFFICEMDIGRIERISVVFLPAAAGQEIWADG